MRNVDGYKLISLCPDPVIGVSGKGIIEVFNPAAESLLGYRANSIIDLLNIVDIYPDLDAAKTVKRLLYSDAYGPKGSLEGFETHVVNHAGIKIPVRLSAALLNAEEGSSIGFFHDLTPRRNLENRLRELSITDELTGLYNQRHFYTVLAAELSRAQRYAHPLCLICFDLDNFKPINDSFGHLEGDRLLSLVGRILKDCLRQGDTAVRYGGDEFMVLLPDTALTSARKTAERIRETFNRECMHSVDQGHDALVQVSLSLGVTESDGFEAADNFVQRADQAMYRAKRQGGDQSVVVKYHPVQQKLP